MTWIAGHNSGNNQASVPVLGIEAAKEGGRETDHRQEFRELHQAVAAFPLVASRFRKIPLEGTS